MGRQEIPEECKNMSRRKREIKWTLILPQQFPLLCTRRWKRGNVLSHIHFSLNTWLGWEQYPGPPYCLVYQLGRNVQDFVERQLFISFHPSAKDICLSCKGRDKRKCLARHLEQTNNLESWKCMCMWPTVNNVAVTPFLMSKGGYFCHQPPVSHKGGLCKLLCLSVDSACNAKTNWKT